MDRSAKFYLGVSYLVVALVSAYLGLSQWIMEKQLYKDYNFSFFTGKIVLEVENNSIGMVFNVAAKIIEFQFTENIDDLKGRLFVREGEGGLKEEFKRYKVTLSDDKKWVTLSVIEGEKIENTITNFGVKSFVDRRLISRFFIEAVRVDGVEVKVYDFLGRYINDQRGNVKLHIPHSFSNISKNIANNYGNSLLMAIKFILLVLLGTQIILYLMAFFWQPQEISDYFKNPDPNADISIVDSAAQKYAIPLGFLGTIFSIWVALETKHEKFSDFNSVLEIFKGGIFTTVLGISTNMVCLLRGNRIKIIKKIKASKK